MQEIGRFSPRPCLKAPLFAWNKRQQDCEDPNQKDAGLGTHEDKGAWNGESPAALETTPKTIPAGSAARRYTASGYF